MTPFGVNPISLAPRTCYLSLGMLVVSSGQVLTPASCLGSKLVSF
jgi:hypothetical protein